MNYYLTPFVREGLRLGLLTGGTAAALARMQAARAEMGYLVLASVRASDLDDSPGGIWRRAVEPAEVKPDPLYTSRFPLQAMQAIR